MAGVPWKPGMPTYCGRCLSPDLEHHADGSAFCRTCGHRTLPSAWRPPTGFVAPQAPPSVGAPAPVPAPAPGVPYPQPAPGGYPAPAGAWYPAPVPKKATFSAIFGGAFDVFTKGFVPLFLVYLALGAVQAAMGYVLLLWVGSAFASMPTDPSQLDLAAFANALGGVFAGLVLLAIASLILGSFVAGGVTHFAVQRHRGAAADMASSMTEGLRRLPSVLGASLLANGIAFSVVLPGVALLFLGVVTLSLAQVILGLFVTLAGLIVAIILLVILSLVVPVVMIEGRRATESLGRSWELTRGHRGTIFLTFLVFGLIAAALGGGADAAATASGSLIISFLADTIVVAISGSWSVLAMAVAYDLIAQPLPGPVPVYVPPGAYGAPPR